MRAKEMCAKFYKIVPKPFYDNDLPKKDSEQNRQENESDRLPEEGNIKRHLKLRSGSLDENKISFIDNNKPWRTGSMEWIKLKLEHDELLAEICSKYNNGNERENEVSKKCIQRLWNVMEEMQNLEYGV